MNEGTGVQEKQVATETLLALTPELFAQQIRAAVNANYQHSSRDK